ncbi:hypothetical protein DPMN_084844 [Dreissena polymorpha]|uniref:Uncharacterized protein n=1 Tax=Dreissena polymorpha TaxID=45954 RepID=A0A9D4BIW1_DREPO|nr:hypothetical protein DPMN_084844 [Dreissena polymorpha]
MKGPKTNNLPPGGHVFQATGTIFYLFRDIIMANLLTKFHDDRNINMASRVLTKKNATTPWRPYIIWTNCLAYAPPPVGHVFKATETIIELIQDIIGTHLLLLTKFYEDLKINVASRVLKRKNAPPPGPIGGGVPPRLPKLEVVVVEKAVDIAILCSTCQDPCGFNLDRFNFIF